MSKWSVSSDGEFRPELMTVEADQMTIEQNGVLVFWVTIPETGARNLHMAFSHDAWMTVTRL